MREAAFAQPNVRILRSLSSAVSLLPPLLARTNDFGQPSLHDAQTISHLEPTLLSGREAKPIHGPTVGIGKHMWDTPLITQQLDFAEILAAGGASHREC